MKGWLYERVAAELAPYGLTPSEYVSEMRVDGASWSHIQDCLRADGLLRTIPNPAPNPVTLKRWVSSVAALRLGGEE